jgi:hypothetical protein
MPVGINFSKAKAERFIDALAHGRPIEPTGNRWTADDMLALAGAAHHAVMSHGPVRLSDRDLSTMSAERREAMDVTFLADLMSAVGFYSELTMRVRYDEYDRDFEPEVKAIVHLTDSGPEVTPISGFRADDDD